MRSSVACLPTGTLASLSLAPDHVVARAAVVYARAVELQNGGAVHWVFWQIRRWCTQDGHSLWSARALSSPDGCGPALGLYVLGGGAELSAHQFKGLATALGIWGALRKPPMLERAALFNLQATAGVLDAPLSELMERDGHFGLSVRAAAMGWNIGP